MRRICPSVEVAQEPSHSRCNSSGIRAHYFADGVLQVLAHYPLSYNEVHR